jgi:hypothetical protein
MTAPLGSSDASVIVILAIIVLVMARRTYRLSQGTPYSPGRVFAYGGFSFLLFGILAASTLYVAVGTWGPIAYGLLAPYAAIIVGAVWVALPHVRARVTFERRGGGTLYYRLPLLIPVLSVVLFVARLGIEVGVFGLAAVGTISFPTSLPAGTLLVLIGADLTYGVSIGLLLGRGLGIRAAAERFLASEKRPAPLPSS